MWGNILKYVGVFAIAAGASIWIGQMGSKPASPDFALPFAANAQEATETAEATEIVVPDMTIGAEDAPISMIEYASFTCPHCASFHADQYKKLKENYIDTGKVKFTFREVYFDKYGMWASMIARCSGPDRFFGMTELIFHNQQTWARAGGDLEIVGELTKLGKIAGLSDDQLQSCMQDADQLRALVAWYQENATRDEIQSTPSFLIDGEKYSNMSYEEFAKVLDEKLGE